MSFVSIPLSTADIATSLADGSVERYVYFPDSFLVLAVLDGTNAVKEVYTRGPDLSGSPDGAGGIGGILACTYASGATYYYHADIMGNVVALTDASGSVVSTFRYTPFGQLSARTGTVLPRYLFSSKEFDRTANLYYYGYRYYAPRLGRWMTRDPLEEDVDGSLYKYVGNATLSKVDSYGLFALGDIAVGCLKSIAKDQLAKKIGKKWDQQMACRKLDDMALDDFDFSLKVCEGLAFDLNLQPTYQNKSIKQILLECITKGIAKKWANGLLNQATDPLEKKLVKKIIEDSVDATVSSALKIDVESKIRMYSMCKGKKLRNILNYRIVLTYDGISVANTDISDPFECANIAFFPHLCGACACCPGNQ